MSYLFGVITSPGQTFERLRDRGGWVLPMIVLTLLSVVLVYIQWPIIERTIETQLANTQQTIPEEAKEMSMTIGRISAYVGAALAPAISMFFVGLLLLLVVERHVAAVFVVQSRLQRRRIDDGDHSGDFFHRNVLRLAEAKTLAGKVAQSQAQGNVQLPTLRGLVIRFTE